MAHSYSTQNHTLDFSTDYELLRVKQGGTVVQTFDLSTVTTVTVTGGNYVIDTGAGIDSPYHKYDTDGAQAELSFNGAILGGTGIVDLRDCGKYGNFSVTYDLACAGVKLRLGTGPKPFHVKPLDADCYTYQEN